MRVAVIGAGAVGSQTAWQLALAGVETVVYERFEAPNRWGAHDGESRLLRGLPYLETAPGDRRILAESIPAWERIQRLSDRSILDQCGGLIIDQPGSEPLRLASEAAEGLPRAHALDHATLTSRYPQFAVDPQELGVLDESGGLADPQQAVAAALELAIEAGAVVRERARVTALHSTDGAVELEFADGSRDRVHRVVLAGGAFARELIPELPLHSRRLLLGWFAPKPGQSGLVGGMPSFVWTAPDGGFLYGGPAEGGATVKVGIDAPWGEVSDAMTGREVTVDDMAPMADAVRRHLPWLDTATARYEMHIDGWSSDGHGILGPLPRDPRILLAVGWTGHGFKISPVLGEIAASLAVTGDTGFDISHLDPARYEALRAA